MLSKTLIKMLWEQTVEWFKLMPSSSVRCTMELLTVWDPIFSKEFLVNSTQSFKDMNNTIPKSALIQFLISFTKISTEKKRNLTSKLAKMKVKLIKKPVSKLGTNTFIETNQSF